MAKFVVTTEFRNYSFPTYANAMAFILHYDPQGHRGLVVTSL